MKVHEPPLGGLSRDPQCSEAAILGTTISKRLGQLHSYLAHDLPRGIQLTTVRYRIPEQFSNHLPRAWSTASSPPIGTSAHPAISYFKELQVRESQTIQVFYSLKTLHQSHICKYKNQRQCQDLKIQTTHIYLHLSKTMFISYNIFKAQGLLFFKRQDKALLKANRQTDQYNHYVQGAAAKYWCELESI